VSNSRCQFQYKCKDKRMFDSIEDLASKLAQWYMLSFEGCEDQFTSEKFDRAFCEYDLFRVVEQPGLLLSEFQPAIA